MAKPVRRKELPRRRAAREIVLPLTRENFRIIGIGLLTIVVGYLAMLQGSVEGFLPLVVSPILLVLGYCVIVPYGIMYRKKPTEKVEAPVETPVRA